MGDVQPIRAWGTENSGYSRDEFYTASRSSDGMSMQKSVTIPAHIGSQIAALVQSGRLPYKTQEDFWRDAAHHRLHDLDEMGALGPEASRRIALWRRQEELERRAAEVEATERLIAETQAMVNRARGIPDWVLLEQVVRDAREAAAGMHEPWSSKMLEVVGETGDGWDDE